MQKPPFFSVLVPTYNQAQYLGEALNSLLAQTDPDWEAIVINDGSSDSTPEVLETYCSSDGRFRPIHKENGGVASALNAGLRQVRGEWICWLSSDDLFDRHKLATHREWIIRHPSCRFFFTHFRYLNDVTRHLRDTWLRTVRESEWQILEMLRSGYIHGNSICVYRDAWAKVGAFNEELRYGQDYDMWLRLLTLYPATFIPERTCITRQHSAQDTRRFPKAGVFNSAKAAINFLNQHSFAELVPLVDLTDSQMARKAISKAIEIAADPYGYLYMLGPHSALLVRIMEWVWSCSDSEIAGAMQKILRYKAREVSCQYAGTTFGFFWKTAAVAIELPQRRFDYQPLSPTLVAETNYWQLKFQNSEDAEQIHRYFERFENRLLPENRPATKRKIKEVVIVCQEGTHLTDVTKDVTSLATLEIAQRLMKSGCMVLLTGLSNQGMGYADGVLFLGAGEESSLARAVSLLRPVDTLVGISRPDISRMTCARRYVNITTAMQGVEAREKSLDILLQMKSERDFIDIFESAPARTSRIRIMFYRIWRRGQIIGKLRRMKRDMVANSRIIRYAITTWGAVSGQPLIRWPGVLKHLWIESQQER